MSFYRDHIYPYLIHHLGDPKPIRAIRQQIVPLTQGRALEIGVGSGVNFGYYNPQRVNKIYALEPNSGMLLLAKQRCRQTQLDVEFLNVPGEHIPLEDGTVDTVVSTFTMCTIPGITKALAGIRRILKPNGKLIFFEHGLSPDLEVRRWQERWEPINRRVLEGCQLTRDIPCLLAQGGLQIEQMERGYLFPFPRPWTYCWWGTAIPSPQKELECQDRK